MLKICRCRYLNNNNYNNNNDNDENNNNYNHHHNNNNNNIIILFKQKTTLSMGLFTGMITHAGCWENTKKAFKSRAEGM